MARRAKQAEDEGVETPDVESAAPPEAQTAVEQTPELWQELELDEAYKDKDAAEIARDLRRQQREAEEAFVEQRSQAEIAAYQYANGAIRQTPEWQEYEKWRAEQQTAQQQPGKKWYERPDFDPSILEDYRVVNEDGTKGPVDRKALAAAGLLDKALAYQQFVENHDGRWERDREGYLNEYLDHALPSRFEKAINEAKAKWEEERDWQEWDRSNADWMYVHDKPLEQGGKRIIDPNTGRWALTQEGLTFHQVYNDLRTDGISNSRAARDRATQIMLGIFAAQQSANPAKQVVIKGHGEAGTSEPAKSTREENRLNQIRSAAASRVGGRGGSAAVAETPGKEQQVRMRKPEDEAAAMFAQRLGLTSGA
jgi:hypothetical protein